MSKQPVLRIDEIDIKLAPKKVSLYAILDLRRPNKQGLYPIRLRITYNRAFRDYGTRQNSTPEEWSKITAKRPKGIAADKKIIILGLLNRAFGIALSIPSFSFTSFNDMYLNKQANDKNNVYNWYADKIKELYKNEQVGTASTYEYSMKALKNFSKKDFLSFDKINVQFLKDFEQWFYNNECSPTTVGIYMRPLRHVINRAIEHPSNFIKDYPFKKYKIPTPKNTKKALSKEEVKSIYLYQSPKGSPEAFYKDIWLFSYFANGINMKDICKLKYKNIKGNTIEFRRAKTIKTNKNTKPIIIVLTDDLFRIIKEYGAKPKADNNYIFSFLKQGLNAEDERKIIKQATKQTNFYIKKVAKQLGIKAEVSTYTARHSFATILKNAGVSPSFIGESMGHSSLRTTENYLGSFETEQRKHNIDKLKEW